MLRFLTASALIASAATVNAAKDWVVLVSGSNGFDNYRHHADVCHAYKIASEWGVPNDQIITMLYDDVAQSPMNPFPGQLFNKPTAVGTEGVDVYANCQKDYVGQDVTAVNFLKVLEGDASAGGKVLKSTEEDNVFINFVDHGAPGLVAMPAGPYLYAKDLLATLDFMSKNKRYGKLVFYVEACESGSLFENVFPDDKKSFISTASNAEESSWGTYCYPDDMINGVEVGSCLGDLYSVNWMENSDAVGQKETLDEQFTIVKNLTDLSHVMQYGDVSFLSDPIGNFQGNLGANLFGRAGHGRKTHNGASKKTVASSSIKPSRANSVNSRDVELHNAYSRYIRASNSELSLKYQTRLNTIVQRRQDTDKFFTELSHAFNNGTSDEMNFYYPPSTKFIHECDSCCKAVENSIKTYCHGLSDYGLKYFSIVMNMCGTGHQSAATTHTLVKAAHDICINNKFDLSNVAY